MANIIELVTKMLPLLDEQYQMASKTAFLDAGPEWIQATANAKRIKVAKMRVDGLANYSRNNGFRAGSVDLVWQEREFTQDRGRAIQVDIMDDEESFGLAFGRLAGEFQRTQVVPEIDAYRFMKYYQNAGHKWSYTLTSTEGIVKYLDRVTAQMNDDEIPDEGRFAFVNPSVYAALINDPELHRYLTWDTMGNLTKKVASYNGVTILPIPSKRFYTEIEILDAPDGNTVGGYRPADDAEVIGIIVMSAASVIQIAKRRISRVWAPTKELAAGTDGVNPDADAWKFDYRIYHDVWVLDNQKDTIYTAQITGVGLGTVTGISLTAVDADGIAVSLAGTAPNYTANNNATANSTVRLIPNVATGNGNLVSKSLRWDSSNNNIAMVQNGFVHFFQAGKVRITVESVFDPSIKADVTFTVTGATSNPIGDTDDALDNAGEEDANTPTTP